MNPRGERAPGLGRRPLLRALPLLVPSLAALLGGCGWHSPYASGSGVGRSAARTGLGLVSVALIPERPGQLLRQALQARFDHGDAPVGKKFDLMVAFGIGSEAIGTQYDNTTTRVRIIGNASWTLMTHDAQRATVTTGHARSVDGLNTFDEQYFAQDLETEAVERRMAEAIADQITTDLAIWFDKHPA